MNKELAKQIIKYPHKLGHFFGFKKLTILHSDWIRLCWLSKKDISLQAHRGSYKTTAIVIVGVIWWLWFHFNDRIGIIRKDFTAASEVLQAITKILNSNKAHIIFKIIYGFDYVLVEETQKSVTWNLKTEVTVQGSISAYSMGEDMTGVHLDKIVTDDFVTIKDRISKTTREKTKIFIQDLRANIIEPGQPLIFAGTPWHKLDAWSILPEPVKYSVYETNLEKFTKEHINYLKSITTASMFAANYELKHISSEDSLFSDPVYCKWDYNLFPVGHIDAKYSGNHTGAFTMMAKRPDGKIQAVGFMFTKHIVDEYNNLLELWKKFKCGTTYLEDNADKGYAAKDLLNLGMLTRTYHESENKFVKIVQNLKTNWDLIEWSDETDPEFISQVLDTQEGQEPDDCADSAASLIRESKILNTGGVSLSVVEYEETFKE